MTQLEQKTQIDNLRLLTSVYEKMIDATASPTTNRQSLMFILIVAMCLCASVAPRAQADDPAPRATAGQKKLKHMLLNLAEIAEQSIPEVEAGFDLVKRNAETGELVEPPVRMVPNGKLFAQKLNQVVGELSSKALDTERLEPILQDLPAAEISLGLAAAADAAAAAAAEAEVDPHVKLVAELQEKLDDRMSRISDLLHFQPDFLTQLATGVEGGELTPIANILRQLVLCVSDESFCLVDIVPVPPPEEAEAPPAEEAEAPPAEEPAPPAAEEAPPAEQEPEPPAEPEAPEEPEDFEEIVEPEPEIILAPPKIGRRKNVHEDRQEEGYYKVKQVDSKNNHHYSEQHRHQYVYNGRNRMEAATAPKPRSFGRFE